jgi:hypothetical protein
MFGQLLEIDPQTNVCGNCEFWKGYRRKNESGQKALVDKMGSGKCINKWGPWNDMVQPSMSTCVSWAAWAELK